MQGLNSPQVLQVPQAPRRYDFDLIRAVSMLAVVYLHTAAGALREPGNLPVWHFSNLITSLATAAVPLFFMLSGALLLGGEKTTNITYLLQKRLPRVLIPLLVWSAAVILMTGLRDGSAAAAQNLLPLLNTPVLVPYWFVYALVPVYLLSPMLKKMVDGLSDTHWRYLLVLWVVFTLGLNTLGDFLPAALRPAVKVHWTLNINLVGGYLGYFLLGYYLERLERIPARKILWGGVALSYLVIALGTWCDTAHTGGYDERYKSYLNIFAAILAASIFLLARSYLKDHRPGGKLLKLLSGASFGVYLAHPMAIKIIQTQWSHFFTGGGQIVSHVWQQILLYVAVVGLCVVGVVLVSSLKLLCYPLTGQRFREASRESNLFALFHPPR